MRVYKIYSTVDSESYIDNHYIGNKKDVLDIDATNPFSLFEFYRVGQIDYIEYRNYCKAYLLPNWNELSELDKKEMVKHNIAPDDATKLLFYSLDEQLENYFDIIKFEVNTREVRWRKAMITAGFMLGVDQLKRLSMYNDTKIFRGDYTEADLPNLILWLTNGTYPALGIDYSTTGFRNKWYYDSNIEIEALKILTK